MEKTRKRYTLRPTVGSFVLFSLGLLFVLAWVFGLGVMVGRNYLPDILSVFSLTKEKTFAGRQEPKTKQVLSIKEEELTFYDHLVIKKDSATKEIITKPVIKDQKKPEEKAQARKIEQVKKSILDYSVQVVALKDKGEAKKIVKRLQQLGHQAYYYRILINGTLFYRVRCGPFSTVVEARTCAKRLAATIHLKPFIVYPPHN
jgi:septal ring-binding cell division protein DamX